MDEDSPISTAVLSIVEELRGGSVSHSQLNRAAHEVDQVGRRLHGLGLGGDHEIAAALTTALSELTAAHHLREDARGAAVARVISGLKTAAANAERSG